MRLQADPPAVCWAAVVFPSWRGSISPQFCFCNMWCCTAVGCRSPPAAPVNMNRQLYRLASWSTLKYKYKTQPLRKKLQAELILYSCIFSVICTFKCRCLGRTIVWNWLHKKAFCEEKVKIRNLSDQVTYCFWTVRVFYFTSFLCWDFFSFNQSQPVCWPFLSVYFLFSVVSLFGISWVLRIVQWFILN